MDRGPFFPWEPEFRSRHSPPKSKGPVPLSRTGLARSIRFVNETELDLRGSLSPGPEGKSGKSSTEED
jgi:hypothetical protein